MTAVSSLDEPLGFLFFVYSVFVLAAGFSLGFLAACNWDHLRKRVRSEHRSKPQPITCHDWKSHLTPEMLDWRTARCRYFDEGDAVEVYVCDWSGKKHGFHISHGKFSFNAELDEELKRFIAQAPLKRRQQAKIQA